MWKIFRGRSSFFISLCIITGQWRGTKEFGSGLAKGPFAEGRGSKRRCLLYGR